MHSWLVALRIARREVRRAKGRTALVVVMIGLPIAALSFVAAAADMAILTPAEQLAREMGTASASLAWTSQQVNQSLDSAARIGGVSTSTNSHTAAEVLALLPPGSTVTQTWDSRVAMHTAGGVGALDASGIDMTSPLTAGMVRLIDGRTPRSADEIAVSPEALARLGAHIGGTVATVASDRPYTVVGTVEVGGRRNETVVFAPSERPGATNAAAYNVRWLVGQHAPVLGEQIRALNAHGIFVTSRQLVLHPPPHPLVHAPSRSEVQEFGVGTLLVGLAVLEVVLLAGPAFAVGARRRQRELALIATAGGAPSTLRRIVLADGVVCGLIASTAGLAVGLGLAFGGRTFLEDLTDSRFGGYRVYPWAVVGVVAVAVVIGLLGALLPAVAVGRQDIVASLSGRRGVTHASRRWLLVGIVLVAVGASVAAYGAYRHESGGVLAGLALAEFGLVTCTPTLVGLIARLGRFLPLAPRLALRDAARRRAAAAPAIAAVMAAVAGSVAITVYVTAQRATQHDVYAQTLPMGTVAMTTADANTGNFIKAPIAALTRAAHTAMPGASTVPLQILDCPYVDRGPEPGGLCGAQLVLPDDRRCPFHEYDVLSKAQQRQALADPRCDSTSPQNFYTYGMPPVVTDAPDVVAALSGLTGARLDAATATLRAGGMLVSDDSYVEDGKSTLLFEGPGKDSGRTIAAPAYAVDTGVTWIAPVYSPAMLRQWHNTAVTTGVLLTPRTVPGQTAEDALTALTIDAAPQTQIYVERGYPGGRSNDGTVALILAAAAAVIALAAAAIATGLAAADARRDLITLGAVGATPRVRRLLSLAQAAVISGTGSVIGVVAGFGAAAAILTGLNQQWAAVWPKPAHYPITVPWLNIGIALVAVPLVAMLGAGLLTRSRLPSERRAD